MWSCKAKRRRRSRRRPPKEEQEQESEEQAEDRRIEEKEEEEGSDLQVVVAAATMAALSLGEKKRQEEQEDECSVCLKVIDESDTDDPPGPALVCGHRYRAFWSAFLSGAVREQSVLRRPVRTVARRCRRWRARKKGFRRLDPKKEVAFVCGFHAL